MTEKKLSICIPTYNRPQQVRDQIAFFISEIELLGVEDVVELVVADNCSQYEMREILNDHVDKTFYSYFINELNVGLLGNIYNLLERSTGKYIWFVGDDDEFMPGILSKALELLEGSSYVFLNHLAYDARSGKTLLKSALPEKFNSVGTICDLFQIFEFSGGSLMFISGSIYRKDCIEIAKNEYQRTQITAPLFFSFFAASKGRVRVLSEIFLRNRWGDVSWTLQQAYVHNVLIPRELMDLEKIGIATETIRKLILDYYRLSPRAFLSSAQVLIGSKYRSLVLSPSLYFCFVLSVFKKILKGIR